VKTTVVLGRKPELDETGTYIELASICDRFNTMPNEGGVLDQNQVVMRKLMIVYAAMQEKQALEEKRRNKRGK